MRWIRLSVVAKGRYQLKNSNENKKLHSLFRDSIFHCLLRPFTKNHIWLGDEYRYLGSTNLGIRSCLLDNWMLGLEGLQIEPINS